MGQERLSWSRPPVEQRLAESAKVVQPQKIFVEPSGGIHVPTTNDGLDGVYFHLHVSLCFPLKLSYPRPCKPLVGEMA